MLSVRDAGPGIAPNLLPTLFDRFSRGSGSAGLGLGLYLARGIVEAHGGTLTVQSRLGQGTTFYLSLPLSEAQVSARRGVAPSPVTCARPCGAAHAAGSTRAMVSSTSSREKCLAMNAA